MTRTDDSPALLSEEGVLELKGPPADTRIYYGNDLLQFGDLYLPKSDGPHPTVIFIHGGMWLGDIDIAHSAKLCAALANNGIAVWSLEYRRVGNPGGGWPGTFQDINQGADHLSTIAAEYKLDMDRVLIMGHSAGGHLALWLAARSSLPADTLVSANSPLQVRGVLGMAAVADLASIHQIDFAQEVIEGLVGGSPEQYPENYQLADPIHLQAPSDLPQVLLNGKYDDDWGAFGITYFKCAKERGDNIRFIEAPECGHFDMMNPDLSTWSMVLEAVLTMLVKVTK